MGKGNVVTLTFAGDSKSLEGAFKSLNGEADKTRSRFSKLASGAKIAAGVFLGGLAVGAKVGFDELKQGQLVAAQTAAVLKSTGGAAKVSADQVSDLATAMMKKSGVDDELIASGANVLLTFTKIRNEAGKNNDVFNRATKSTLDMSVALGMDMKSAAILTGKALNDPIKGLTALGRSGIQFTASQKDSIKAMVESGNTMGAQKVILKELEKQFGGSADAAGKTLAGQINVAEQTFSNLAGSIVGAVLPAFTGMAGVLNTVLGWMTKHETTTKVVLGLLTGLAIGVFAVNAAVKVWAASQVVLNAVLAANPVMLVVLAIAALAAGVVIAYRNSETFRNIVKTAFDVVKVAAGGVRTAVDAVVDAVRAAKDSPVVAALALLFTGQFRIAKAAIQGVIDIVGGVTDAIRAVKDSKAMDTIAGVFSTVFGAIKGTIDGVVSAIGNITSAIQTAMGWFDKLFSRGKTLSSGEFLTGIRNAGKAAQGRADGGIINTATLVRAGEAGPEAIIPLSRPGRAAQIMQQAGLTGGGGNVHIAQMVVQDATDAYRVASQLSRHLRMAA